MSWHLISFFKADLGTLGGNHFLLDTGNDRQKMRRKSDCSGLMAFQIQQQQKLIHQQQLIDSRPKRNRSLDRSNEHLQIHRNAGLGGSHYGLNRQLNMSGSTTHLNIQLGPLQMYPRYNDECECLLSATLNMYPQNIMT